jgi:two-component system response regulator PhoP
MRVLIIEDEARVAGNIASALRESVGLAVDLAADGDMGVHLAGYGHYDLILLDLMLPKLDGMSVLRRLRARGILTPLLVLSARDATDSIIELLNAGADDYLAKPFDLGELLARVKALIRRGKGAASPILSLQDIELNTVNQSVRRGGQHIDLSPMEYRILEYLMHHPDAVVSKRELLEHLYDYNWERHSNVIEAHISNLRRKLSTYAPMPFFATLRGRGYRLTPHVPPAQVNEAS